MNLRPSARHAFFDVDGTIFDGVTVTEFERYFSGCDTAVDDLLEANLTRSELNRRLILRYSGRKVEDIEKEAWLWFEQCCRGRTIASTESLLNSLRSEGFEPVFVSGSPSILLRPLANCLAVRFVFGVELEQIANTFTGRAVPPRPLGRGKAEVVRRFLKQSGVAAKSCAACGDHDSDRFMLQMVGRAFVVPGNSKLERAAKTRGWKILEKEPF